MATKQNLRKGKRERRGRVERLKKTLSCNTQRLEKLYETNKELEELIRELTTENKLVKRYYHIASNYTGCQLYNNNISYAL